MSPVLPILIDGIVGTRPNLMKMAPLARAIEQDATFRLRLIHTGQHYDEQMSDVFFRELGLPQPFINLAVGSGNHGAQTAKILERYEAFLLKEEKPRGVVVVGDVNSTMACTLAAVKLGIPVAHVEAGLRSGDRAMPEEVNRIVTDALAELLFVSDPEGLINLAAEGQEKTKIRFVGNIMADSLYAKLAAAEASTILQELELTPQSYAYVTLHRPSNVDDPGVLCNLMQVMSELSQDLPFVFSVHPRTRARLEQEGTPMPPVESFRVIGALGYVENLRMIKDARVVLTDSGGIQEETSILGVPCLTLRENTERPITVELGSSELVGPDPIRIRKAWAQLKNGQWKQPSPIPLWDGHTAGRIVSHLRQAWGSHGV